MSSAPIVDCTLRLDVSNREVFELLRGKKSRVAASAGTQAKSSVRARYDSASQRITFSSRLHKRLPVHFVLKPGSRSHHNFLNLLFSEITRFEAGATAIDSSDATCTQMRNLIRRVETELTNSAVTEAHSAADVVTLYKQDFELLRGADAELENEGFEDEQQFGLQVVDPDSGASLFSTTLDNSKPTFRFIGDKEPLLISGFVAHEAPTKFSVTVLKPLFDDWRSVVMFHPTMSCVSAAGQVTLRGEVAIPKKLRSSLELFVHWGPRDEESWRDEEIAHFELEEQEGDWLRFEKRLQADQLGPHGATVCAQVVGTNQRLWLSDLGISDAEFLVTGATLYAGTKRVQQRRTSEAESRAKLVRSLQSYQRFIKTVDQLSKSDSGRRVSKLLHDIAGDDVELRALLSTYYEQLRAELAPGSTLQSPTPQGRVPHSKKSLSRVLHVLRTIGIGEVVFVTPEGPHAIAGGLAQVIVGLTKALNGEGVPTTIIAPLYDRAQGSKHASAEQVLKEGVVLADQRVPLERCGEVKVSFGPTRIAGTLQRKQFARVVPVQVYKAEKGKVRLFLLHHPTLADALYSYSSGDDALRKAVFLSRGALEVLRSRHFDVVPDVIISNDWVSALVPIYLQCDTRYSKFGHFEGVQTIHMLHNAGEAYQGRFFVNEYGQDLWPLLGLDDEHFFGLADPGSRDYLNFTTGAIHHLNGALLTVSQPYAAELLQPELSGRLATVLRSKPDLVFGISNGVDRDALLLALRGLAEESASSIGSPPLFRNRKVRSSDVVRKLDEIKHTLKQSTQKRFGLEQNEQAVVLSMVGRLTSQKGVQLLTSPLLGQEAVLLEQLLEREPEVQVLIAGPMERQDKQIEIFERRFNALKLQFPGRLASHFDFLPHREALAITCGSDLFLMPSQYEPGGITQLEALTAGTNVVAHRVGGIAATLQQFNANRSHGDSFLFSRFCADAFYAEIERAVCCLRNQECLKKARAAAVNAQHDWRNRVGSYLALFHSVGGLLDEDSGYSFLKEDARSIASLRPDYRHS